MLTTLIAAALLLIAQHPQMPPGISHEEHVKQIQNDEALKKRGAAAMGFDQDAVIHHFRLASTGGSIEVTIKNSGDDETLAAVRGHLRAIADEFSHGKFDKPFQTHGEIAPGVATMQANPGRISFRYMELPDGGAVRVATSDASLLQAAHAFLRYQIIEHHTGDSLDVTR